MSPAPAIVAAACLAFLLLALWTHTRVRGWIPEDVPHGSRKQHAKATPLAGFVPAIVTVAACVWFEYAWLAAACAIAAATGFADDALKAPPRDGMDWRPKCASLVAVTGLATVEVASLTQLDATSIALAAAGIFVLTNATNFLDNTDGVSTGLGAWALLALGTAGEPLAFAVAGAWLAFLPFNWPRARLFLGDSGALSLGVAVGTLAFVHAARAHGDGSLDVFALIAPTALLWLDFVQVVAARLILGYAPWVADRRHLTHILQNAGLPVAATAPTFVGGAALVYLTITGS